MPDEPQYDEKTDCSLTKTAQIIGMPLPCHQGPATSDRERVLAQGYTRLNGCVRHIIPGNAHRVWSRLLTSVSPTCAALSVGSASSSDDRQRCLREDRAYWQAHERKLQLRMSLFSSYLHMMHNAVDSLRATPYGELD